MIQWTIAGEGQRLGMIVRHTDAQRVCAYDRKSHTGRLDQAANKGWTVVDMKQE